MILVVSKEKVHLVHANFSVQNCFRFAKIEVAVTTRKKAVDHVIALCMPYPEETWIAAGRPISPFFEVGPYIINASFMCVHVQSI